MNSLFLLWVTIQGFLTTVQPHSLGFHGLDGEPSLTPEFPQITGPFEVEVTFRFDGDGFTGGLQYQRVFDFCFGATSDSNIAIGQHDDTQSLMMEITLSGANPLSYYLYTGVQYEVSGDEVETLLAGVDDNGLMWMEIDGTYMTGDTIPNPEIALNLPRDTQLIGKSCLPRDSDLYGAVLGMRVTPGHNQSRIGVEQNRFRNLPSQVFSPFTVSFWARFDDPTGKANQEIFRFDNVLGTSAIYMGNVGATRSMRLGIVQDGTEYSMTIGYAINPGEVALWHAAVDPNGKMRIKKQTEFSISSNSYYPGFEGEWRKELRTSMEFGTSLLGFVLGFQLDVDDSS